MFVHSFFEIEKMEDTYFHELKKQAYFFFKTNIKLARLALTHATPAQLLTEEATSGNPWPPDSPTMREITRAAFEVDDFFRIVDILHKRLEKFEAKDWRGNYNSVILLEHVLTHGPQSFAKEFEDDDIKQVLKDMDAFQFVDDKGFNWGESVRKLSGRVIKLVEDEEFLRQERIKARNITRGIHGFGNLTRRSSFPQTRFNYKQRIDLVPEPASKIVVIPNEKEEEIREDVKKKNGDSESGSKKEDGEITEIDHPFSSIKHYRLSQSLLHEPESSSQQN